MLMEVPKNILPKRPFDAGFTLVKIRLTKADPRKRGEFLSQLLCPLGLNSSKHLNPMLLAFNSHFVWHLMHCTAHSAFCTLAGAVWLHALRLMTIFVWCCHSDWSKSTSKRQRVCRIGLTRIDLHQIQWACRILDFRQAIHFVGLINYFIFVWTEAISVTWALVPGMSS